MAFRCWLAFASVVALANGGPVQQPNLQLPSTAAAQQEAVVALFNRSYTAYKKYAWGHDELRPITESHYDDMNGWGMTPSDALDTMWLMGFRDWFKDAVDYLSQVDFSRSKTVDAVPVHAATARYVGGLLSAYELSGKQYHVLVQKAEQVAQQMVYAFIGDNPIPYSQINFTDHSYVNETVDIAEAGSLTMEWNRLSLYTNNDTYRQLAEKSVQHIIHMPTVLPGMPAQSIDPSTGNSVESYVTWGDGSDSYYEYLIKYPRLTNTNDSSYADAWLSAVDTSIKTLLKNSTVGNWTYLADYDGQNILHVGSHLACFYGGNWILGGKLTNNDTIFNIGLQLTNACWNTYASTATGIGPEEFAYFSSDGNYTGDSLPTPGQIQFYDEHGYYITASPYNMRPQVLESNFYAWRATGNIRYLDNAASAIKSFQTYLPTAVAYGGLEDVNDETSSQIDKIPGSWFAEVLKYLYLTLDDPNKISLDDYVFNTGGHPFKAPEAKSVYGSAT